MSLLGRGNAFLERKRPAATAVAITYRRGAVGLAINATPNRGEVEQITDTGAAVRLEDWQWIIRASDLSAFTPDKPRAGDAILRTIGANVYEFTVTGGGGDLPCWRWADEDQLAIRVFAKYLKMT